MAQSDTVTLLFSNLADATDHLQQAGDEAVDREILAHHKMMSEAVASCGGRELEWLGDGVLASYLSAADAVHSAILMQQTAQRRTAGTPFDIRIGIHFGEVMRRDTGYFGTPVVVARRLCDRAATGQILCSSVIAELLEARQTFAFRDLGKFELKGITEPVGVCEVVYERDDAAAMLSRTPFVGRAGQLKRLSARLEDASNGHGSIAMLRGEPGIGKSRTIEEFADLARQHGAVVLRGACYDGEWQPPYGPFAEAILDYARVAPDEFAAAMGKRASIIARIAPALHDLIPEIPEPVSLDKDEERFRLFDAVAQLLIAASQRAPIVLVLDDLHWADRGVVAMLNHVAHFVPANPILLIGAYRDAEVDRKHPLGAALAGMRRLPNFEDIALEGLESGELANLLEIIGDQDAPEALVKALGHATDGNPLFIREVLLHLLEEGKILRDGQGWISKLGVDQLGIPEGVRQVIGRRLGRLSESANRLLSIASAFNGAFSFEVAASVAELDESTALAAIDEALDAQLLRSGVTPDTFDFTHAMIRHTLYAELNPARRVRLHRKIGEQMERSWGTRVSQHAAEVAFQFWRGATASGTTRGAEYAIAAADNAESAYAHDDVVAFLRIALELLPKNDPRRPRLMARLGFALTWILDGDEAAKIGLEAGTLIAASESAAVAADYFETMALEMYRCGLMHNSWAMTKEGLRHIGARRDLTWVTLDELDTLRADAEDPNNPGIIADSPRLRERRAVLKTIPSELAKARQIGITYPYDSRDEILRDPDCDANALVFLAGECRRGLPLWQQRAEEAERSGRIAWAMEAWASVARCHNALGSFPEARAAYDRAIALSARVNRRSLQLLNMISVRYDLMIALDDGWDVTLVSVPEEDELVANWPPEFRWAWSAACACISEVLAQRNVPDAAMMLLGTVRDALLRGAEWGLLYNMTACDAAASLWLLNRTDYIDVIESSILEKVLVPDFRCPMRDGRLSMARLCALQGRYDEALDWLNRAREIFEEGGRRPLRAITDYDEALMYLRRGAPGDGERARPLLAIALRQFRDIGMIGWIRRAEQAAAQDAPRNVAVLE